MTVIASHPSIARSRLFAVVDCPIRTGYATEISRVTSKVGGARSRSQTARKPASDIWALGCAIFRIRSCDDLFFDYDTDSPADALRQIVKAVGELPENWRHTKFDKEGFAVVDGEGGELFWSLEETWPLKDQVRGIVDEPPGFVHKSLGEAVKAMDGGPEAAIFDDNAALR
ncbi:hypothetical protein B7494_g5279 [Chlorociboria aeruginascens]|nr:hypothetical protein B7494_g5279 [Chlorociboria aeruginascens]